MTDSVKIQMLSKELNISLAEMAREIGLTRPQLLYDIRNGKCNISKKIANRISDKFDISPLWLLHGIGYMHHFSHTTSLVNAYLMADIKDFRRKNNLTQKELADYLGIGNAFISFIEHGRCKLPPRQLDKILNNDKGWDTSMFVPDLKPENWIISENTYTSKHHDAAALKRVGLRIEEICNIKNIQQQFLAENIGLDYKKLVNIIAGNEPAPEQLLLKILATYPDINPCWLCLGVGKPYKV